MTLFAAAALALGLSAPAHADSPVSVGEPALLFTLPALNEDATIEIVGSSRVSLGDFVGVRPARTAELVVVHFFGKSGPSAAVELAALERLQRRYGPKGLQILAITADDGDLGTLSTWVEDQKLTFPVLRDNHRVVSTRYDLRSEPVTVIVDGAGRIFAIGNPSGSGLEAELDGEIAAGIAR